jgi:hypothetical protein
LKSGGRRPSGRLNGPPPRHFSYFDEFETDEPAAAAARGSGSRAGAGVADRVDDIGEALSRRAHADDHDLRVDEPQAAPDSVDCAAHVRDRRAGGPRGCVIAFLIAVISAYIGAQQLRPFGAEIFTVDSSRDRRLRELGVLLTAIMVAGRTGSAYAAELGVMKLNDEVDALESMGMDPFEVLVLPRVIGLVIALPLLTIVADFMGTGRRLLTRFLIDLPWPQFLARLDASVATRRSGRAHQGTRVRRDHR